MLANFFLSKYLPFFDSSVGDVFHRVWIFCYSQVQASMAGLVCRGYDLLAFLTRTHTNTYTRMTNRTKCSEREKTT